MKSDAEVICEFMEPRPTQGKMAIVTPWWHSITLMTGSGPGGGFARIGVTHRELDLNALREVEARLTMEQWQQYQWNAEHAGWYPSDTGEPTVRECFRAASHASAAQKIRALAAVLRAFV